MGGTWKHSSEMVHTSWVCTVELCVWGCGGAVCVWVYGVCGGAVCVGVVELCVCVCVCVGVCGGAVCVGGGVVQFCEIC